MWPQFLAVAFNGLHRRSTNWNEPLLVALSGDEYDGEFLLPIAQPECSCLTGTKAGAVHHLDECAISLPEFARSRCGCFNERPHLLRREHPRKSLPPCGWYEWSGWASFDAALGFEIFEEHANRGEMPRNAARLHTPIAVQGLHMRCEIAWADVIRHDDIVLRHVLDQIAQVPPIRGQRSGRQAALDAKPSQEVTYRLVEAAHVMTP